MYIIIIVLDDILQFKLKLDATFYAVRLILNTTYEIILKRVKLIQI